MKSIFVCSEIHYNQRGGGFKQINNSISVIPIGGNANTEYEYNYKNYIIKSIDVPLYLRIGYNEPNALLFFNVGLSYSRVFKYVYSYNTWNLDNVIAVEDWHKTEINDSINTHSLSFLFGLGIRRTFKKCVIIPEIRVSRFITEELIVDGEKQNSHNFLFTVSFSFLFHPNF